MSQPKQKLHKRVVNKFIFIGKNIPQVLRLERIINERDQFYMEKQILFDQSNNWRVFLANKYLKGSGIEIGPAEHPLPVPHWTKVKYVDEISTEDLIKLYPYLKGHDLVHVDVVDDGQALSKFKDDSQNFIIANHFYEHIIDPIKTLRNFYRVLKTDGVIFMAIPDKRFTFDKLRPVTPLSRLKKFHADPKAGEAGKWPMFVESAQYIEGKQGKEIKTRAQELFDQKFSVHLNVWSQHDLLDLILYIIREYKLDLDFETVVKNQHEIILILKKQPKSKIKENPSVKKARKALSTKNKKK
ncbi:MAG: methyltransferase domain-containing protein [Candidatus Saccharibacteria bacterium]|nr:methyltransferase domain-containing protein [Candidatus Saccharibacteria bacterium]